ncbi:hypothetical protein VV99743_03310 [Vibrio vulnificus]|uniref:hypothetical protein n=1 Tax=Vibrio vulnificus TaxID=672 RepID=UPI000929CBDB|nr:hypothetical protein [Vibrio vulnificus]OJI30795.1 hypothetical protein VV99743_03310 [Vibrio vulnificus]
MQVRYRSDYSNHVHQLVVTVSKHFYVTKQGKFKRQSTPFKAVIGKSSSYTKTHVVHYMITDHYSGLFYSEVTTSDDLFPIEAFLERAWGGKSGHPMQGEPNLLVVPKSVFNAFPSLSSWLHQKPIELVQATSGFQAGIRSIRTWEEVLRTGGSFRYQTGFPPDFTEVQANSFDSCVFQTRKNFTKWSEGLNI